MRLGKRLIIRGEEVENLGLCRKKKRENDFLQGEAERSEHNDTVFWRESHRWCVEKFSSKLATGDEWQWCDLSERAFQESLVNQMLFIRLRRYRFVGCD